MAGKRRRNATKPKVKPQDSLPESANAPLEPSPTKSPKGKSPSDTRPSRRPSVHLTAEDFDKYQSHCHRMTLSQVGYYPDTSRLKIDYLNLQDEVHSWTDAFVCVDTPSLSRVQKQMIIRRLDKYCIQESWTKIQSLLSPSYRAVFHYYLAEAMIYQTIFTHLLEKPFRFLDGKRDGTDKTGDLSFSERIQYLYERYYESSPVNAVWWKSVTLSLANLKEDDMAKSSRDKTPYEFGDRSRKRQANMAKGLADQLLADSLFQLLLRELAGAEEETARRERLVKLFQDTARALTNHEVMLGGQVKVHQLPELEKFDTSTGLMFSAKQEDPPLYVPKPRGRVILVVRPGVCRYDTPIRYVPFSHRPLRLEELEGEPTSWLICKAEVLMEKVRTDRSSDKYESDPEDRDVSP
ncbi:ATP synthase complex subunit h family protein [Aspergillus tubingensis]|uniref:ATP synthase complex subunit h family protein n=1 Tax=Aspergillus tubingensis TaxID=5068 RepID=UPI001577BF8A|nr:ATP synthase complex subunit h family protein [Aspergillus tubingensis]GFN16027.1 ATP synthase complex subunit h family protein [Aspergillus tubingensis]GLA91076.1 hypothetical protein AtubIFM57143_003094 [Aspergillus tubingensis]GLB15580.1 hypothetical protein AtubIFM61612_005404 [Aspergillus tubingensis]